MSNLCLPWLPQVFTTVQSQTRGMELSKMLWLKSASSEVWLERRTNYARSLAVMSMAGYILGGLVELVGIETRRSCTVLSPRVCHVKPRCLPASLTFSLRLHVSSLTGLGDRHPSNLMIDRISGRIVHIDFGDCFEVRATCLLGGAYRRLERLFLQREAIGGLIKLTCPASALSQVAMTRTKFPERVPFRLTRMLINAMEAGGIEGASATPLTMIPIRQMTF
jgi:FKBP12-rapamycin complex-associated protein